MRSSLGPCGASLNGGPLVCIAFHDEFGSRWLCQSSVSQYLVAVNRDAEKFPFSTFLISKVPWEIFMYCTVENGYRDYLGS